MYDLGSLPEHLHAAPLLQNRDAHRPYLLRLRQEITPGNAWRRARPRVNAPEMSTIVRAGEASGAWETGRDLPGDTRRAEVVVERTSEDLYPPLPRWGCPVSPHPAPPRSQAGEAGTFPTPALPAARL